MELISDNVARQVTVDDTQQVISDEILDKVLDRSTVADEETSGLFKMTIHKAETGQSLLKSLATST